MTGKIRLDSGREKENGMELTKYQKEILRLMKALGMKEKEATSLMKFVENPKEAEKVIDKILDLEDNGETLTKEKLTRIIVTA